MPKSFIAHSSKDKKRYVDIVVKHIGYNRCIYDELTFEEGMKTLEEIEKWLDKTDLFVIFISDSALNSDWVKLELVKASYLLKKKLIKRIYPIIIDSNITHKDPRIPEWMRNEYIIKPISRPSLAAKRIIRRLKEISWDFHPRLKERKKIFVGRNELINQFEERIHSLDLQTVTCIIASGFTKIGRKTLLKYGLIKTNDIDLSYEPSVIELNTHESIEDFIYKVYDLGFSEKINLTDFLSIPVIDKEKIAIKLIYDIQKSREILFINDRGCIVTPEGKINNWFRKILEELLNSNRITFCIASSFRLHSYSALHFKNLFYLHVPELDPKERTALLIQYSDFEKLNLKREQLKIISSLLSGFPEQVFYVAELIKDMGIKKTLDNSYLIREYNFDKVIPILDKYKQNKETMEFLQLLASFDFIGYDLIFEIAEEDFYKDLLQEFIARAICEHLGATKEYIRLNDAIRDYVRRANKEIPTQFEDKLKQHYIKFLKNYKTEEIDVADLFYSMKQALLSGEDIDPSYLIPSHFLKTMKELYDEKKNYEDIVKLADRVLQNEKNMDEFIVFQIRYYLCQSLAKLKDTRFTKEVQKIKGSEHNFLLGFYYRQLGNNIKAIERQKMALKERKYFPRAQRELVQLYLNLEDFDKALDLAKTNYCNSKNNPYHIQAYFRCLINSEKNSENSKIIKELLPNLDKIKTDKGKEMFLQAKAQYYAFFKNDKLKAYQYVEQAIYDFPNVHYTYLTKFDICERFDDILGMKDAIKYLEGKVRRQNFLYNTLLGKKAIYYSKTKDIKKARDLLKEIKNYPENALERLHTKIETIYKTNS